MMRIFSYLVFFISISFPVLVNANIPFALTDLTAGVFRFQVKLAEQGNTEAQYKVGEMYEQGKGVTQDMLEAVIWLEKAASQGHKKATYKLLYIEIAANGLNDFTKSQLGVLRQEAASGNYNAQYFLGKMYAAGVGMPKSLHNALTWLNKATFNGVSEAEHEAIAVEEELARIRERESKKRAVAIVAAKKKRAEESKQQEIKHQQAEKQRLANIARKTSAEKAKAQRLADDRRRFDQERSAFVAERERLQQEKIEQAKADAQAEAMREQEQVVQKAPEKKKSSFVSDPCEGRSARFLSTCR